MIGLKQSVLFALIAIAAGGHLLSSQAKAQTISSFTAGDLVVSVEGNGAAGGAGSTTGVPYIGPYTGGPYTDNQGAPLTLFQYGLNGTSSATYAGNLALPQAATGANGFVISWFISASPAGADRQ